MKKIVLIAFAAVLAVDFCAQIATSYAGRSFIDKGLENIGKVVQIHDLKVEHGLFGSSAKFSIKHKFGSEFSDEAPLEVEINAKSRYILLPMFSSFEAEVSATNEPYANFVQSTFSSKTPLKIGASFGFFGDSKLKFSLMPMDLDLGVTKIKTKTANLEIGLNKGKVTSADLAISKGDFVYSGLFGAADLVLDGFYSHTTYAGIDFSDILEVVDAKGEISIDKIYSKGLNFELAGIHSVSNQSIKDGKIAGDIDLKIDKFKIIDASIKNFTFELAASNLDKAVYDEIADCYETDEFKDPAAFLKLLSLEPKIDKFALNFENASGKKAEFDLKISMENAKNINYLNIQKSLNLSGKFSTQFALSSISPLLSEFREIEEKLLQVGVLVKKGDGYECKFSFDKEKEDLIFNEEILSAAIYSYD